MSVSLRARSWQACSAEKRSRHALGGEAAVEGASAVIELVLAQFILKAGQRWGIEALGGPTHKGHSCALANHRRREVDGDALVELQLACVVGRGGCEEGRRKGRV